MESVAKYRKVLLTVYFPMLSYTFRYFPILVVPRSANKKKKSKATLGGASQRAFPNLTDEPNQADDDPLLLPVNSLVELPTKTGPPLMSREINQRPLRQYIHGVV